MFVVEVYDPAEDFKFVRSQILFSNEECDPFHYGDENQVSFLKDQKWMTNGTILVLNDVLHGQFLFFDL